MEPARNELAVPTTEAERRCVSGFSPRRARVERSGTGVGRGVSRLRFKRIVLNVQARQDESLDSPALLELAKAGSMMLFKSYHRSGQYLFARERCPQNSRP